VCRFTFLVCFVAMLSVWDWPRVRTWSKTAEKTHVLYVIGIVPWAGPWRHGMVARERDDI